jgi:hypothetical protein
MLNACGWCYRQLATDSSSKGLLLVYSQQVYIAVRGGGGKLIQHDITPYGAILLMSCACVQVLSYAPNGPGLHLHVLSGRQHSLLNTLTRILNSTPLRPLQASGSDVCRLRHPMSDVPS